MAIDLFDEEVKSDYITIGGKKRPTHNSNGDLIYPTVQGIVNFYKWFGNSKVVDEQGRPLVVYHGSGTKELFDIFNNGQGRAGSKLYVGSYWFTNNYKMAQSYANVYTQDYVTGYENDEVIDQNPIYAGYLRIVKPFVVDFEGANWDGDAIGKVSLYQIVFGQKQLIRKSKTQTFFDSYEEAYLRAQQMGLPEDKYEIYTDSVRPEGATDEIIHQQLEKRIKKKVIKYVGQEVVRAFKNKNASDGAIFQNIVDYGHINDDEDVTTIPTGTDFVIYSPNQFKSINNSGYFSRSDKMNEAFEMNKILENAGVSLPNENSLGEKIISDDDPVKLQNFWNWFGDSKLVDEQGRPLVVYHGSKQANIREFQSKYSDALIFFAYKKEFSENWAKRAIVFDDQRRQIDDFHSSDEYRNIRNQLTNKYKEKYGENFTDNDEIFSQYEKEYRLIDKNFLNKIGIKETVYSVYIKANKIFNTKRDYKIILDDLDKAWKLELDADYTQELKTTLEKYNDVRNKINQWVKTIDRKHLISKDDEEINKKEAELQKELDDANENYMYWKRKESGRNEALNYIKNGYWMYFERKEIVDRIWELGYDAIELAEHTYSENDDSSLETTTIAVRPGNNQIKSINNNGEFSMSSDNIYETFEMNKILENAGVSLLNENSLGEKIIPDDDPVKLQNFWNWFFNSKCVDEQGRPLVVYHGTNNKFDTFDKLKMGSNAGFAGGGFYFSEIQESSSQYDEGTAHSYGTNIIVAYLNVKNPLTFDEKTISKDTYLKILNTHHCYGGKWESIYDEANSDGTLFKSITSRDASYFRITPQEWIEIFEELGFDGLKDDENHWWQVFEPNQIKSINNNGEFSMSSNNIYESRVNKTLKESLEFHSKLNNKIWNGFKLKEKVHDALYKIADVFTRSLEVPNLELEDVVITGSLCNYNYNKNSDIDLHLVVDFEKLGITPEDFVQKYFNAKKTEFNTKHDIKVYGYPVELYVEDVKSPARATGRYSLLDNQWINTPKGMKDEVVDISDNKKYKEYVDKIDSLEDDDASLEHASDLLSEIYDMRASGLEKDGELSEDNLVFKELRNGGYLDKLREYMIDTMDDKLSLTESYRRLSEGFYDESSEEEKIETIKKYPRFIEDMDNPSVAVQMAAIEDDPMNISYIKNPAPEVQMDAVQRDIFVLNYIKKPAVEVQVYAVEQDPNNITYIKKPSKVAIKKAVELNPDLLEIYYEGGRNKIPVDVLLPIIKNAEYYQISELILMAARSGLSKNPEIQAAFVEKDPDFILHFENPTNEAYVAYINHDWKNIYKLYNKGVYITTEMINAVIKQAYKQGELPKAIDELMKIVFLFPENLLTAINLDYNVLDLVVNVAEPDKWRSEHYEVQSVPEKIKNKARKLGWKG